MTPSESELLDRKHKLVIFASSLGNVFEWYDFYIYGTLAAFFGKLFFPVDNPTTGFLASLALFGVGFPSGLSARWSSAGLVTSWAASTHSSLRSP